MMKRALCFAGLCAVIVCSSASSVQAGGFFKKLFGKDSDCCEPTCCEPEPVCCEPEPVCCEPEPVCCEPEPVCCEPEPECCEPEPVCCEPEPEPCCASTTVPVGNFAYHSSGSYYYSQPVASAYVSAPRTTYASASMTSKLPVSYRYISVRR